MTADRRLLLARSLLLSLGSRATTAEDSPSEVRIEKG